MTASFVTNTNWQPIAGETNLSYFSQAVGLAVQNFLSPAVGIAVAFALLRGLASSDGGKLGNFFVDVVRAVLYLSLIHIFSYEDDLSIAEKIEAIARRVYHADGVVFEPAAQKAVSYTHLNSP